MPRRRSSRRGTRCWGGRQRSTSGRRRIGRGRGEDAASDEPEKSVFSLRPSSDPSASIRKGTAASTGSIPNALNMIFHVTHFARCSFGLRIGLVNRSASSVRRSLQKKKSLSDARFKVQTTRRKNQEGREKKAREVMEEHTRRGEEARRGKEERREVSCVCVCVCVCVYLICHFTLPSQLILQRQIASTQKIVARKLLYRSGVNTLEDIEQQAAGLNWKLE